MRTNILAKSNTFPGVRHDYIKWRCDTCGAEIAGDMNRPKNEDGSDWVCIQRGSDGYDFCNLACALNKFSASSEIQDKLKIIKELSYNINGTEVAFVSVMLQDEGGKIRPTFTIMGEPSEDLRHQLGEALYELADRIVLNERKCRVCGCTDNDCSQCVDASGERCYWVEKDLCSRCGGEHSAEGME